MTTPVDAHKYLHSEQGAMRAEHPGRSRNPVIKVRDLAWLEFEKPDLGRAEAFAREFGFATVLHTANEVHLRGTDAGSPCVIIRRGPRSRFVGPAFAAQDKADLARLASGSSPAWESWPSCPPSSRTLSTSAMRCAAPTPPSARRGSRPGYRDWGIW